MTLRKRCGVEATQDTKTTRCRSGGILIRINNSVIRGRDPRGRLVGRIVWGSRGVSGARDAGRVGGASAGSECLTSPRTGFLGAVMGRSLRGRGRSPGHLMGVQRAPATPSCDSENRPKPPHHHPPHDPPTSSPRQTNHAAPTRGTRGCRKRARAGPNLVPRPLGTPICPTTRNADPGGPHAGAHPKPRRCTPQLGIPAPTDPNKVTPKRLCPPAKAHSYPVAQ